MDNVTNQNTDNENTPAQTSNGGNEQVNMTQEQLNELINKKYAKGAEKAKSELLESLGIDSVDTLKSTIQAQRDAEENQKTELQKMQERLEALEKEKSTLAKDAEMAKTKAEVNALSAQNGIKDIEVFEMLYKNASSGEGFEKDKFINELKETRPFLFGEVQKPKTDNSSNTKQNPLNFAERVKNAKTKAELDALYAELG